MSKAKFEATRQLIAEKKYAEARAILNTIDHPTARQWLAKLDTLAPAPPARRRIRVRHILAVLILVLGVAAVILSIRAAKYDAEVRQFMATELQYQRETVIPGS